MLTVGETSEFLHCSASAVYRFVASGRLAHFRLGSERGRIRIPGVAVQEFLARYVTDALAGDAVAVEREPRTVDA